MLAVVVLVDVVAVVSLVKPLPRVEVLVDHLLVVMAVTEQPILVVAVVVPEPILPVAQVEVVVMVDLVLLLFVISLDK
jgi:hypothetical protein